MDRPHASLLALATLFAIATGCAAAPPHANLNYSDRARAAYETALAQFNDNDLLDAAESFRHIRREYGLSHWAWLAELRLADIDFKQDKFAEAITGYRTWLRYHPTQPEVPEARFGIARAYYAQIPSDIFITPPSYDRDQSSMHDAEDALTRFITDFPDTHFTADARTDLRRVRSLLARHEMSVAAFYRARNHPDAALSRYQGVLETYGGSGVEAETLLAMGETYLLMNRRAEAHDAFATIVARYGDSPFIEPARRYLAFIGPLRAADLVPPSDAPSASPEPSSSPPAAHGS